MTIRKPVQIFLLLIFFTFILTNAPVNKTQASTVIFQDNFDDGDASGWLEINGTGEWKVIDGEYVGTVTLIRPERPALSFAGSREWDNYKFEFDVKSIKGVDKAAIFRYQDPGNFYIVNIRSMSQLAGGNDIVFQKIIDSHAQVIARIPYINYENTWYHIKIILNGPGVKIFINDELKINHTENENVLRNGKIGLIVWPGGHTNGEGDITTLVYDNVIVTKLPYSNTLDTVILIPGLGASWNHEAMILGVYKKPKEWHMTPFVKNYEGLIQTLENAGYLRVGDNQNLFVFNYDWRLPIETIAHQLKDHIENDINPSNDMNIDIIGHSLGGKVARTYVQNNPDHQVDQLITLGSPHRGAPQVYYLWEGADLKKFLLPWQRIGAGILLHLNKKGYQNNVETIRSILPGLKDLLPTFPYIKHYGIEKPLSQMNQRNSWLEDFNQLSLPDFLTSVFFNFVGIKGDTLRWINTAERNRFDKFLGRWADGKPKDEEYKTGDGSVLMESAKLSGVSALELPNLDHGDLVESVDGQQAIIDLLGVSPTEIIPAPEILYEPSLIFQIASPANLTIFDPNDSIVADREKLVFIPAPKEGEYEIQINKEDGGGNFRLLIGKVFHEKDIWQEIDGQVADEPQIYQISFYNNSAINRIELLRLSKKKLELVKNKLFESQSPFKSLIIFSIKWRIYQINNIINLLKTGQESRAHIQIKQALFSLIFFEKNLKFWTKFYPLEFQEELREDLRLAEDYLLQAYELE